jgi:cell division protein FtsQ
VLASGSSRTAVAADGTVLTGLATPRGVPLIRLAGGVPRGRVTSGPDLARVRVAAGAPAALRARVESIGRERGRGLVALLRDGPKLLFGDGTRLAAKWAAAASVLADPAAAGAAYVDLRIPERPAAGGLPVETVAPLAPAEAPAGAVPAPAAAAAPGAPVATTPAPAPQAPATQTPQGPGAAPAPATPDADAKTPLPAPVTAGGGAAPNPQP